MVLSDTTSYTPLILIIRFATAIPDLRLPISSPTTANAATICTLIRPHLPPNLASCPLRLIYAGALLPSSKPLSTTLRLSPRPPPPPLPFDSGAKVPLPPHSKEQQQQRQLYIHCSIVSDATLTPRELENEARASASLSRAASNASSRSKVEDKDEAKENLDHKKCARRRITPPPISPQSIPSPSSPLSSSSLPHQQSQPEQQPLGFDRLLSAGLTPPEIASLRTHFLALQAHTHTPDTMPSPTSLRLLEERWLDDENDATAANGNAGEDAEGAGWGWIMDSGTGSEGGALEDMFYGTLAGFFWSVGAVVWLVREDGVWSPRRQMSVVMGVVVNMAFCFLGWMIKGGG